MRSYPRMCEAALDGHLVRVERPVVVAARRHIEAALDGHLVRVERPVVVASSPNINLDRQPFRVNIVLLLRSFCCCDRR